MNYYAVRKGKTPGIYNTWEECRLQVIGYKGAEYKKFPTIDQAREFIKASLPFGDNVEFDALGPEEMVCYVDGSFNEKTGVFGYGVVSFTAEGKKVYNGALDNDERAHRNVAGEIHGAIFAMDKAVQDEKTKLYIHHDYAGISHWAKGEWKTNYPMTQNYKAHYESLKDKVEVVFVKVKAHSNDLYNDEADKLAKEAVGIGG